jgi:hypothetical protein
MLTKSINQSSIILEITPEACPDMSKLVKTSPNQLKPVETSSNKARPPGVDS